MYLVTYAARKQILRLTTYTANFVWPRKPQAYMAVSSSILENSLCTLPPDVILNVTIFLSARDKLALRLTCRSLYSTLSTPTAWRQVHWIYYNRKERNALKSILKLAQTVVEEVILTGPIVESPLTELYRCKQLRKVSGFKFTPAQLSKLMSSLPNLTHASIDVNLSLIHI